MAHESHAPDTTFIVAEPDFVFYREDGEKHMEWLNAEEHRAQSFARWDEMADLIPSERGRAQVVPVVRRGPRVFPRSPAQRSPSTAWSPLPP